MIDADLAGIIAYCNQRWPHRPVGADSLPIWREDLGDVSVEEAHAAIRDMARAGREFPPTSGQILSHIRRANQAPPPSFEDMQRILAKNMHHLSDGVNDRPIEEALQRLMNAGVHEAVCLFVAQQGIFAVRMMPDNSMHSLDPGLMADRRDKARQYEQRTIPAWEQDPTPGLALSQVRGKSAGLRKFSGAPALGQGKQAD